MSTEDKPATYFVIRPARKDASDAIFIAEAFDASQDFLASIGSGLQWGSKKKSQDAAFVAELEGYVTESIEDQDKTGCLIAEKNHISCGGAIVLSNVPDYVEGSIEAMSALKGLTNFDYLYILVADQRVQPLSKGVGSALIQHVKLEARRKGRKAVLVDCWDGNNGLLESYYCKQGFHRIARLSKMGKHIDGIMWKGVLLRMDL